MKVRITKAPNGGTQRVRVTSLPNQLAPNYVPGGNMSAPEFSVANTLQPVPRHEANIEAEKGETVLMPDKGGLPAHYKIGGSRHSNGGTPLNVTKDSFVYSDTKKLRIKDPDILAEFGKSKGSWTPADLAKKYDINKFRKILQDPDSDPLMVSTAEKMIANYNLKLAKLALVQESKKGFPQGIPEAAMPYLATYNIEPDSILPFKQQQTEDVPYEDVTPQAKWGGVPRAQNGLSVSGQDPETLKRFYEEQMRKRQIRESAKEFEKKKAVAEFYAKERAAKLAAQKAAAKKKLDESYKTLEQLSGKKHLPLGSMKRAMGFDNAYDQYINNLGAYTSLFPTPPIDTSGVNPSVPYQNLPKMVMPAPAKPWPQVPKSAPAVVESSAPAPAVSTDAGMEAEIKDLMNTEKISRKEAIYILTGK